MTSYSFVSRRSVVTGFNGAVATSQPLAAMAGLRMLLQGGNAADAAVATAAALNVVEPMSTGAGGDAFALLYWAKEKKVYALNASGRAAYAATPEAFSRRGLRSVPNRGILSVTVPGAVAGWADTIARFIERRLALDPDNSSRIYASVALKGIYKINMADSAPTWAYASGGISGDKIMLGVSVAPGTGGQTLLAASTDMGVFMTTDGGNLWNRWGATAYNQNVESVLALEFEGRLVFLAGTNGAGVYRSNDQGNSWFSYSTGLTNMRTRTLSSASAYLAAGDYIFLGSGSGAWRRELVD